MQKILMILSICLPIIGGFAVPFFGFTKRRAREIYVLAVVIATSVCALTLCAQGNTAEFILFNLTSTFPIMFQLDGLGRIFVALVSVLWPFASLYAFEYMSSEHRENTFFTYYTMSFGVTLGIAFAGNMITMYLFYELLTFITLPIIMHERNEEGFKAGKKYIIYSIGGATASFVGIVLFMSSGGNINYVLGGGWTGAATAQFFAAFLLCFFGFGVKAAVFPLHDWLPTAGVAPTPVTALLHAVAVVKAGTFAIIRVSYYSFGMDLLHGSLASQVALIFTAITIVYGSAMALRETHFKRRMAYSTVSNLSYILFGAMLFTPQGLSAGLTHMLFHGLMKITLFYVAGIVNNKVHRYYVTELGGLGRKMPLTFAAFTVAGLALTGMPPLCGFTSKYLLAAAAVQEGGFAPYLGVAALLISAVLTAVYCLQIVVTAYFPGKDFDASVNDGVKDPNWYMLLPICLFALLMIYFGCNPQPIIDFVTLL